MSSNKRRDPRFESNKKLWFEGQGDRAEARNMSRSGMFVTSEQPREVGEQIKVAFESEEGATIEVNMEVMWRGAPAQDGQAGMGLRIVGFDKGEDVYDKFVKEQLKAQGLDDGGGGGGGDKK
jgi:Tfp pilus assembly protein PilZ